MSEDQRPPEEPESSELPPTETAPPTSVSGQQIGPYRIFQKLGEGGMGEVLEAEQEKPVRRRVALKLIKWGMDTKQVVARFESERQALAMMDHPNIARVFDGGATDKGRPYFAMEFVKGEPITQYCDRHLLSTKERLKLFMQVCEGVQHAHQKGIIHRDLKPSNVLVTIQDDKPVPKIIDFGVAKATEQRLTEKTVFTQMGVLIGTPEYMSPEQAEMTVLDIDTRTDVYSLGVMLYELMTGVLPFDPKELRSSGFDEIRRKIREKEPSKPSARISTLPDVAKKRKIELPALQRELKGDLDWITLRAMEKDRTRRYGSPNELAADVDRYLTDQPVLATPPSAAYKAKKFVRRHKVGVVAGMAVFLVLIAGIAGTTIGLVRATRAETDAKREAAAAEQVSNFLVDLFEVSDPSEARGNTITAREILDKGAEKIETELSDQPLVQARLSDTMGWVYQHLGLYDEAVTLMERAVNSRAAVLGDRDVLTLRTKSGLCLFYYFAERYGQADLVCNEAVMGLREVLGDDHRHTLYAMTRIAPMYGQVRGMYAEAERLHRASYEGLRKLYGDLNGSTLNSLQNVAICVGNQGRHEEAEEIYLQVLDSYRQMSEGDGINALMAMSQLASAVRAQGRHDEAELLYEEAIEAQRRVLGEEHNITLLALIGLAKLYAGQDRTAEAEQLYRNVVEIRERVDGPANAHTLSAMNRLASLYLSTGDEQNARALAARRLDIYKQAASRKDADPEKKNDAAVALITCKPEDLRDAKTALRLALEVNDSTGHANPKYLQTLARVYHQTGDTAKAIEVQKKAISLIGEGRDSAKFVERLDEFEASLSDSAE
jgi:non-specific serine/threonine protein kinase/serine/threonine-protein kinase